jgi:hypothetical protein
MEIKKEREKKKEKQKGLHVLNWIFVWNMTCTLMEKA